MMSPVLGGRDAVVDLFHFEAPGDIGEPDPAHLAPPPPDRFDRELGGISSVTS